LASVSCSIARLETRLGVRLFTRTTRSIRLTGDGKLYRAECQQALDQIAGAERAIPGNQKVPGGALRVSVPPTYAHYRLLPLLPSFSTALPKIELELNISNRIIDFVEEGYDLAIRLGEPRDSRLIAHALEDATLGVFAAPAYVRERGTPQTLADMRQHDCLQCVLPSTGRAMPWIFKDGTGGDVDFTFRSRMRVP
jgi:DNA-binding transcriptional LysR family regulator